MIVRKYLLMLKGISFRIAPQIENQQKSMNSIFLFDFRRNDENALEVCHLIELSLQFVTAIVIN